MIKAIALTLALYFCTTGAPKTWEAPGTVREIEGVVGEYTADSVYTFIHTSDGNGWAVDLDPTFQAGDYVTIVFDTMGTQSIYDDEIIDFIRGETL